MAISSELRGRIAAIARQLCEEAGEVDESQGVCWLDAVENQAIEIADALAAEVMKRQSADRPVADALRYLTNQQPRMKYAEDRTQGLPTTSSHIESTIKQINRRVKGSEKFWDQGAEPLLQLAADHRSETEPLRRFWKRRPTNCLRPAAITPPPKKQTAGGTHEGSGW